MTKAEKKKLLSTNAAIWAAAILLSFVLPMVMESLADGPANFLKMMMHVFPLAAALMISSNLIGTAIGEPADE